MNREIKKTENQPRRTLKKAVNREIEKVWRKYFTRYEIPDTRY